MTNVSQTRSDGLGDLSCLSHTKTFKLGNVTVFAATLKDVLNKCASCAFSAEKTSVHFIFVSNREKIIVIFIFKGVLNRVFPLMTCWAACRFGNSLTVFLAFHRVPLRGSLQTLRKWRNMLRFTFSMHVSGTHRCTRMGRISQSFLWSDSLLTRFLRHIESRSVGLCVKAFTCGYYLSVGFSEVGEKY